MTEKINANIGDPGPISSDLVRTVNGKCGPGVEIEIGDLNGLTGTLTTLQKTGAAQGEEIKDLREKITTLSHTVWTLFGVSALLVIVQLAELADRL